MRKEQLDDLMRQVGELHRPQTWEEIDRENRHAIYFLATLVGCLTMVLIALGIYTRS